MSISNFLRIGKMFMANYKISESNCTIKEMSKKSYLTSDTANIIEKSNVLLIPNETYADYPVFPENTTSFLNYLKEKTKDSDMVVDICINDENYKELEMHDAVVTLSSIIFQEPFYSIIINIISNYIYELIKKKGEKTLTIKTDILVEKNGETKKIHYEGSAEEFDKTMKSIKKNIL